jgi:hypothetical protein
LWFRTGVGSWGIDCGVNSVTLLGGGAQRTPVLTSKIEEEFSPNSPNYITIKQGGSDMGDKGSKDKGKKEHQKAAQHTAKEKRKLKREKKKK